MTTLKIKKLHKDAVIPTQAYEGDAGLDLYSIEDVQVAPGAQVEVRTGIALETPKGYFIQLHTRSSYGKRGLRCHLGIIDEGYRGEITVWVQNPLFKEDVISSLTTREPFIIEKGDKVCQLVLCQKQKFDIKTVETLSESERGEKGHGSSGR